MKPQFSSPRDIERKVIALALDERGHRINTGETPCQFRIYGPDTAVVPVTVDTVHIALRAVGVQDEAIEADLKDWLAQWTQPDVK